MARPTLLSKINLVAAIGARGRNRGGEKEKNRGKRGAQRAAKRINKCRSTARIDAPLLRNAAREKLCAREMFAVFAEPLLRRPINSRGRKTSRTRACINHRTSLHRIGRGFEEGEKEKKRKKKIGRFARPPGNILFAWSGLTQGNKSKDEALW